MSRKKIQIYLQVGIMFFLIFSIFSIDGTNPKQIAQAASPKNYFTKRYVYLRGHVSNQSELTRMLNIMTRAATAGYNGVVIEDFDAVYNWDTNAKYYIANRTAIETKASQLGMTVIPYYFINNGIAEGGQDKDIVESFPVQDTNFLVSSGTARVTTSPVVTIPNSGFESWNLGYTMPSNYYAVGTTRSTTAHSGTYSAKIDCTLRGVAYSGYGPSDLVSVTAHRGYEASFWIKTEGVTDPNISLRFNVNGYDSTGSSSRYSLYRKQATFLPAGTATTKDWTQYKVTFNSLDKVKLRISIGSEDGSSSPGAFYLDDLTIGEVGLRNTVRRQNLSTADQLPIVVKSSNGATTYTEGTDYNYVMGTELLTIPTGSRITNGQTVKVSWYQKADNLASDPEVNVCHNLYWDKLGADLDHLNQVYPTAAGFFINIDEWSYGNWDPACKNYNTQNPGQDMTGVQYMAYNMQKNEVLYKSKKPNAPLYVWNDMFDIYHNAVNNYLSYNGDLTGSVSGVSSGTTIVNWNSQRDLVGGQTKTYNSLKYFGDIGYHQIIAGYYDTGDTSNDQFLRDTLNTLEATPGGISGIDGYMYTSWDPTNTSDGGTGFGDFTQLESVAKIFKDDGRWGAPPTIIKTANPSSVVSGGEITYNLDIQNNQTSVLNSASVTDVLPTGVTYAPGSADNGGTYNEYTKTVSWTINNLNPSSRVIVSFKVRVD